MDLIEKLFFCIILLFPICAGNSQTVDPQYEIGTWRGFKQCAVCFTFDDNCYNQLTIAMPIFDKYGFKMTLFTVINWVNDWNALETAALNGHEIASHTVTHPLLSTLTNDEQITEFKDSRNSINSHIQNQKCMTIAYPNCDCGNPSICNQYYIAGRSCGDIIELKTPPNFMGIRSLICGTEGSVKRASDFINRINSAAASEGWAVFMLHSIDVESGPDCNSPVSSAELDGALAYLSQNKDKYWEATFYDVVRYIKERNNVSVQELSDNDSLITFSVTSDYIYPFTITRFLLGEFSLMTGISLSF